MCSHASRNCKFAFHSGKYMLRKIFSKFDPKQDVCLALNLISSINEHFYQIVQVETKLKAIFFTGKQVDS